jgi:hypothetical protein
VKKKPKEIPCMLMKMLMEHLSSFHICAFDMKGEPICHREITESKDEYALDQLMTDQISYHEPAKKVRVLEDRNE